MNEITTIREANGNIAAEQQLLGMILTNNSALDLVSDVLQAEHFQDPVHQFIFEVAAKRITNGHLASPVTLGPLMGDRLKELGGIPYLFRMAGSSITEAAARDYAGMIVDCAARRRLTEAAEKAIADIGAGGDTRDTATALQQALQALPEGPSSESTHSLAKVMTATVEKAAAAYQGETAFLKTGVEVLDAIIRGLAPGDVCLIGGTTSMGKTSLALEIAANVALKQDRGVAFVSLEMDRHDLATRMACAIGRVPYESLRDAGSMSEDDFRKFVLASKEVAKGRMRITPRNVRDMAAIHAAVRRAKREMGDLALVIIDYAQLIRGTGKDRYDKMTEVSVGIKGLAGLIEVPVIALVQLDRKIGEREDKRPHLNDIKETGQFENDADQVIFCHREGYWLERQGPKVDKSGQITVQARADWEADLSAVRNVMELLVRKNRHGRLATAQVGFHAPTNRFWKLDGEQD